MKKICGLLLILFPIMTFSQQLVNGYSIGFFVGKPYSTTENFNFLYENETYSAEIDDALSLGGTISLPFDIGIRRHRFSIAPAIEYTLTRNYLSCDREVYSNSNLLKDSIVLDITTYTPFIQLMYRNHFYIGGIHASFGIGADFKYTAYKTVSINDKDGATLVAYNNNSTPANDGYIGINDCQSTKYLYNLKFYICPRISFDFYPSKSLMISIHASLPDIQKYINNVSFVGNAGISLTYLVNSKKITEAQILQQYKK